MIRYAIGAGLILAILFGTYSCGVSNENTRWQSEWSARDTRDAQAVEKASRESRDKEQAAQQSVNEVSQNASAQLGRLETSGADLAAAGAGLRESASKLASNSEVSCDTGSPKRGASTTRAAMVLSELLGRAEKRLSELARLYDEARVRGMACQSSYERIHRDLQ